MKSTNTIETLTIEEKAFMFFKLFRDHMPHCVDFIETMAERIYTDKNFVKETWTGQHHTIGAWVNIAIDTHKLFYKYRDKLKADPKIFARQLFKPYYSRLTLYCLKEYKKITPSLSMPKAIELFFEMPDSSSHQ